MKVLVIDIGGNSVKFLINGESEPRKFPSGPELTPRQLGRGGSTSISPRHSVVP